MQNTQERPPVMKSLSLVSLGLAGFVLCVRVPITAHAEDTFSVGPQQMVSFGPVTAMSIVRRRADIPQRQHGHGAAASEGRELHLPLRRRRRPQRAAALRWSVRPVDGLQGDAAADHRGRSRASSGPSAPRRRSQPSASAHPRATPPPSLAYPQRYVAAARLSDAASAASAHPFWLCGTAHRRPPPPRP